ncbi:hypothetical protein KKC88_02365 [Patescibacteria group bacterium]|nr:hypothetical protein [Patescibacteria group bacterium]MBU1672956.1 hypothetical protein [Patescibacteria group bacterium]
MSKAVITKDDLDSSGSGSVTLKQQIGQVQQHMAKLVFVACDAMVGVVTDPNKPDSPVMFTAPGPCMVTVGELQEDITLTVHLGQVDLMVNDDKKYLEPGYPPIKLSTGTFLKIIVTANPAVLEWGFGH